MSRRDPLTAALALHKWLLEAHFRGGELVGPDCGIRVNYRAGRFVKSYLRALPWRDDLYYLQGQAYWILANWRLVDRTDDQRHAEIAIACARSVLDRQLPDGSWPYPNPEWRGRVANAEGSWAAIALAETYRRCGDERMLAAALRWHDFLERHIGYQPAPGGVAARYFAGGSGAPVPNTSVFVLRLLAELADTTGDDRHLDRAPALLGFLAEAQRASGELPYQVAGAGERARFDHFQCPQYNAFECLDALRYAELTDSSAAREIADGLARFLLRCAGDDGRVPYACDRRDPEVTYHATAVAAALASAARPRDMEVMATVDRVLQRALSAQRADGSFPHSRRDYGVLSDVRSYPRHLAMVLDHVLVVDAARSGVEVAG